MSSTLTPSAMILDLDGVVWLSQRPIPGSPQAVARMRANGILVLFATNNSAPLVGDHERALAAIGIGWAILTPALLRAARRLDGYAQP